MDNRKWKSSLGIQPKKYKVFNKFFVFNIHNKMNVPGYGWKSW